jgi:hypothetical protein
MRRISVTKAAAAVLLALSLLAGLGGAAAKPRPAPPFSGVTLAGKTVSLDQFRGKPLFLVYMTST